MLLKRGDKVLLVHRRLFDSDTGRHFVGAVEAYDSGVVKVAGWTFVRGDAGFLKKPQKRMKIMSRASDGVLGFELPAEVNLEALHFLDHGGGRVVLTDGAGFEFDMTERPRAAA
jgi:hypothetical protein